MIPAEKDSISCYLIRLHRKGPETLALGIVIVT